MTAAADKIDSNEINEEEQGEDEEKGSSGEQYVDSPMREEENKES